METRRRQSGEGRRRGERERRGVVPLKAEVGTDCLWIHDSVEGEGMGRERFGATWLDELPRGLIGCSNDLMMTWNNEKPRSREAGRRMPQTDRMCVGQLPRLSLSHWNTPTGS
ncbi:unnamed protein product [Caenorhabditis nigoni]